MSTIPSPSGDGSVERTADGGVIRFERHLPYPVRAVWDAVTNPERLADWWLPFDADITVDLREGGQMRFVSREDETVQLSCTILPRRGTDAARTHPPGPDRQCGSIGSSKRWTPVACCDSATS